ncbi:hypothetical protein [Flavobacterium chungangensis]|uniref:Uncharacterized protein n=1 Tax=Flavobacterium chungangensis TaxID=2708132 RepID=A0ABV8ZE83_9FLAO
MNLKIFVDYYNAGEEKLFECYPNYQELKTLVGKEITISKDEFLSYMMFTEQADEDGWRTFLELKKKVQHRLGDIQDILDFSNGSIQSKQSSERMFASKMTERIGVSIGINVINKFHSLTEADWAITPNTYIDGKRVKDFDYEIEMASDGVKFIQVENKGTVSDDNNLKSTSVSKHYGSIKAKKSNIITRNKDNEICENENIYYGTIAVLDNTNTAKLWLVDPEAFQVEWSPRKFKLISRLLYYSDIFSIIGVHKAIQKSLKDRISQLIESENIEDFNKNPLKSNARFPMTFLETSNFVNINNSLAFGAFFFIENDNGGDVFIMALTKTIIKLVIAQDFDNILEYEFVDAEFLEKVSIELSVRSSKISSDFEKTKTDFVFDKKRKRYFYQKYQKISSISSGRIFGLIDSTKIK